MGVRTRIAGSRPVEVAKVFGPGVPESFQRGEAASQMTPASPFSPGTPIGPYDGYDRQPRAFDFTTGYNIATRPRTHERVSFDTLTGLIEAYDVAQLAIWHRIDSIRSLDWKLIADDSYSGDVTDAIDIGMAALRKPDRINRFEAWLAKWLYDVLAYDAGCLYRLRNRGGRCIGLSVVDGRTIAPLLDYWGNPPGAMTPAGEPLPASHVQYANGLPWNWLTWADLIYEPFRPVPNSPYGRAPLESIILNANTDIRFQLFFLQRFTEGNLPAAFASSPESWSPDQIEQFQAYWDSFMYSDQSRKHQIRWLPPGSKFEWSNEKDFSDHFSLFMMRKSLAAYHVVPSDMGFTECYSDDTECLTDRGWLRYDELLADDRVATYNPQTREIEYHVPTHKYVAPYEGEMVHFKSRSVDVLVTPHHRMWAWTQTKDRAPHLRPWREVRAEDLAGMSRFGFVGHAVSDAPDIDGFTLPAIVSKGRNPVDRRIPMDLWLEFLGYMISEGCVHRQNGHRHYNISLSQSNRANAEKVPQFTRCLEQLPISWTVRDFERDDCRGWAVGDKSLWTWLVANIGQGSRGKHLPDWFRQLGKRQATILLDALLLGDGAVDNRECSTGREYGTMSSQLASEVQELAYKLGYRVTATCNSIGFWRVNITDGRDHQLGHQNVTRQPYNGIVWCVEVPHHLFVTRRNGKISVQGNTVNRSSGESQADVQHRIGDLPLIRYAQGILTGFLKDDLGLPLRHAFDLGEEQDDRLQQAQADDIYIKNGTVGTSEIREMRFGLPEPGGKPVPRFIFTNRAGPIPLSSLVDVAGPVDEATGAPVPGMELPHKEFEPVEGVVPVPPPPAPALAERLYGPAAVPPPPPGPLALPPGQPVAKDGEAAPGITSETGIYGYDLIRGDEDEEPDEPAQIAKEMAAFRRFRTARRKAGAWRDFQFAAVPPVQAHNLNDSGRLAVRKAAGEVAVAGLAVLAADTGRVLMLQRALCDDDPAAGKLEFPGGHIEGDETPLTGAWREFCEETGCPPPPGVETGSWTSPDGIYQGMVWTADSEASVPVRGEAFIPNPDDPDGDAVEAVMWVDPADLPGNPMLRDELAADLDIVMAALGCGEEAAGTCCGADCCAGGCCDGSGGCTCGTGEVVKAYPDGQSYGDHAFRSTGPFDGFPDGMPAVCHYCGMAESDPFHHNHRDAVAKAGDAGPTALDLGNLTGVWADIYARRERLLRRHQRAVAEAWDACIAELGSPRDLVRDFRQQAGLVAKAADPDRAWRKDTATASVLAWLQQLYSTKGYPALVAAIGEAIREGMAEGEADALALAADKQGVKDFVIAAAFTAASDRLAGDTAVARQARDAAAGILDGAAGDAGSALADQAGADGSEQDTAGAVDEALSGDNSSLSTRLADLSWSAIGAGALAFYSLVSQTGAATADSASAAVQVDWLSEPGACPVCEQNTANGPYAPEDVPPYLAHPHCRCWLASMQGLPASLLASFLS